MSAVLRTIGADIRRRRLQTGIIALVIALSSGAATLALNLVVESDAPYDHAFAQANGAHLTLSYTAAKVSRRQLQATASAPGVTATSGPWPELRVQAVPGGGGGSFSKSGPGLPPIGIDLVGRNRPDTVVDRLSIESGRWVRSAGEVVISRQLSDSMQVDTGGTLEVQQGSGQVTLRVVGVAASISPVTDAWAEPGQVRTLVGGKSVLQEQMVYRVQPSATVTDLRRAEQAITAHLPAGAVVNSSSYLQVKQNADLTTAVMIPFLMAFSVFALVAAALIIANVVSGVVIAGYRDIGIMKAVGFTPGQVTAVLTGQILAPALAGTIAGIAVGTLGSQPFLADTAHALQLPAPFTASLLVEVGVLATVLALALVSALVPATRAGRLSAVAAIARGTAPSAQDHPAGSQGRRISSIVARWPLPRTLTLGLADACSRPLPSAMTVGAILVGVASVVFALSLHSSLRQVARHLIRDPYVQVQVSRSPQYSDRQVVALLQHDAATARYTAEAESRITIPHIAEPIPYDAYRGNASWIGFALISGRWFAHAGEVVAPTAVFRQTGLKLGDHFTAVLQGKSVRLTLVGEILDQQDNDLLLRGTWATLAAANPHVQPTDYEIGLKPGADANRYVSRLFFAGGGSIDPRTVASSSGNTTFVLLNSVIAGLALILILIAVAGVFNTVVLTTRERVRDVAILKAVGMAPIQVVAMVVLSVALLGVPAGILGIPAGLELHRQILTIMGQVASGTHIPPAFFDIFGPGSLILLALTGVVIAALGALIPASWAASSGVAEVLQTE